MRLMLKKTSPRQCLYDGQESQELYSRLFHIENISFKISDILNSSFRKLSSSITENQFGILEKDFGSTSLEGLDIYYLIESQVVYLFSFGEIQPARYLLFFEATYDFIN